MADFSIPAALVPNEATLSTPVTSPAATPQDFSPQISEDPHAPESVQWLVDKAANKTIKVPSSHIPSMVLSGEYDLPAVGKQYALGKDGSVVQVDNAKYADALRAGVVIPASDADVRKSLYEEKYGNSEFTAGAAGALRGATMGLSDPLLTKSGLVNPGTLAGLESANPTSSTVGEVGGTIAGILSPIGPIAEATKAGQIAERAAVKMLGKGAVEAGLSKNVARSIIEKAIPSAVGSAVEGSLFTSGGLISESALGKADYNAENVAATAGIGALLGAGLGTAFSGLKELAPMAEGVGKKIIGIDEHFANPATNAKELLGVTDSKWDKFNKFDKDFANKTVDALRDPERIGLKATDSADVLAQKVQDFHAKAGEKIGDSLEAIKQEAFKTPEILPDAKEVYRKLEKKSYDFAKELEFAEGVSAPEKAADYAAARRFEDSYGSMVKAAKDGQKMDIDTLQKMRQSLDDAAKFDIVKNQDPAKIAIAKQLRYVLREEIDALANKVSPEIGAGLKQANADYYLGSKLIDPIAVKAAKGHSIGLKDLLLGELVNEVGGSGVITAGVLGAKKLLQSDLKRRLVVLGTVEKANMAISKALNNSTAKFFTSNAEKLPTALRLNATAKLADFSLSRSEDGKKPQSMAQTYNNLQQNLSHYASDPKKLANKLQTSTAAIAHSAPDTAAALTMTGTKALNFLNSKLPRKLNDPTVLQRPYLPSGTEMAKFERYLTAVEKPVEVLKNFADGKMSREESEALQQVYPDLFSRLQDQAMSYVGANPHLPYNKKLQLGVLLGIPTDPSLQPQNILGLQGNFSSQQPQPTQPESGAVKPSQKGLQNLKFDSRIDGENEED